MEVFTISKKKKRVFNKGNLTKAEQIAKTPIDQVMKMSGDDINTLRKYVSTMRSSYIRRIASFKRKGIYSYAQDAFEKSLPSGRRGVDINKLSRNQLIFEFARYSSFFNSMTSSEKGIKNVNMEQDQRLFGTDSRGRPNFRMSEEQRKAFWSTYDRYLSTEPVGVNRYGYGTIQSKLADMVMSGEEISADNINDAIEKLNKKLEENDSFNFEEGPNVYSGRGFTFK